MRDMLLGPVTALLDPSARVFVPFLIASAVLAAAGFAARGIGPRGIGRMLFDRRVWLHRSAIADYQLIAVKAVLRALTVGGLAISGLAIGALTCAWLRRNVGASPIAAGTFSAITVGAAYTLAAFLVEDFSRYAVHRAMHRVPALWAFHEVHHSAEVMTPFTLYRTHPVESAVNGARGAITIGLVTGVCAWLFGPQLRAWEVLGVDAIGFVWTLLGANLRHSHVWVSYGPRWEHVLMSPAQHQIHHSAAPQHVDRNYGTVLSLWDWLSGSLYVTRERERLRFGLPGAARAPAGLGAMLLQPFGVVLRPLSPVLVRAGLCLAFVGILSSCSDNRFDRGALLTAMGENALVVTRRFEADATALAGATAAFAQAPSEATRATARVAWTTASATWQELELLRFGPLAAVESPGGEALRDPIYAWPLVTRCLIEQNIVAPPAAADVGALGLDVRGLGAMEYLLFFPGTENQCGASSPINAQGTWAALSAAELLARKATYASALAADLTTRAKHLVTASTAFVGELKRAGTGSAILTTQQLAFNAIAEPLFFLDTEVKDRKLAIPLGLQECPIASCSTSFESEWAGRGKQHLRANLLGAQLLLEGGVAPSSPLGFDDLLVAAGAAPIAVDLRADLAAALAAVDALPDAPLAELVGTHFALLKNVHDRVKALTDFLKMEFTATLQIKPPARVEGDND